MTGHAHFVEIRRWRSILFSLCCEAADMGIRCMPLCTRNSWLWSGFRIPSRHVVDYLRSRSAGNNALITVSSRSALLPASLFSQVDMMQIHSMSTILLFAVLASFSLGQCLPSDNGPSAGSKSASALILSHGTGDAVQNPLTRIAQSTETGVST